VKPKRRKRYRQPRKLSEAEVRHIVRDEMLRNAEELAPFVLGEIIARERRRPGKLVRLDRKG